MELLAAALLIVGIIVLALYLLAKRIRTWKEQILHSVSIVESNNAIAHEATRRELSERWTAEIATVRKDIDELAQQTSLRRLARSYGSPPRFMADTHPPSTRFDEALAFLRKLDFAGDKPEAERTYFEIHLRRLARTLDITPAPDTTRRALELGAYMQITPALAYVLGYSEVRAAYFGPPGQEPVRKTVSIGNSQVFTCDVDLFDAERDPYPYPDDHFDVVLACEIVEHLRLDPMHMFLEVRRVLAPNGTLVLTTPNVASFTSVARAMSGVNPQIWSRYPRADTEVPHVREYTPAELYDALVDAGFVVDSLFTEPINPGHAEEWLGPLLDQLGFPRNLRGEQIYVLARKRPGAKITRRPEFLYE